MKVDAVVNAANTDLRMAAAYGHTHTSQEDAYFQKCVNDFLNDPKYICEGEKKGAAINVGCMQPYMGYEPRTLKELLPPELLS
ncbi:MAG: hypothetical protein LIO76_01250 [Clostridiales bacterium]|nr:hypothetical protein [Clostridiales bacterium]